MGWNFPLYLGIFVRASRKQSLLKSFKKPALPWCSHYGRFSEHSLDFYLCPFNLAWLYFWNRTLIRKSDGHKKIETCLRTYSVRVNALHGSLMNFLSEGGEIWAHEKKCNCISNQCRVIEPMRSTRGLRGWGLTMGCQYLWKVLPGLTDWNDDLLQDNFASVLWSWASYIPYLRFHFFSYVKWEY